MLSFFSTEQQPKGVLAQVHVQLIKSISKLPGTERFCPLERNLVLQTSWPKSLVQRNSDIHQFTNSTICQLTNQASCPKRFINSTGMWVISKKIMNLMSSEIYKNTRILKEGVLIKYTLPFQMRHLPTLRWSPKTALDLHHPVEGAIENLSNLIS